MDKPNRNLLVLFNQELMNQQAMEHEVDMLHELLYKVERLDNIIKAHEVIHLNKFKIINKASYLRKTLRQRELKPFIFLNNKN
jgi:hypothetical protein